MALDRQRVFNTVWTKLYEQGYPCVSIRGGCLYRGGNGAKCAIGHLIPDELYVGHRLEGRSASCPSVYQRVDPEYGAVEGWDIDFLSSLQSAHDCSSEDYPSGGPVWLAYFISRMEAIATVWGLSTDGLPRVDDEDSSQ